ncbi:electron transport complex subunit RsxC [Alteromonas sp. ASW11-19]|uniref:Ion-translocating oxidoreductase complex subunit C n=1 Tax=Alteromonas salexigens TaxID=2982530 RepID=A0ABT2VPA6_9ALTE|nr:electron transport complex subunit RsxC [Alteromonas salexigens]MCU7555142.1 electron transport complex subunit RsxC [Alteromonas salexigens]
MYPAFDEIIENLNRNKLHRFPGGVHPDGRKELSATTPTQRLPLPQLVTVPLRQHAGTDGQCDVSVGDKVLKGQPLTTSQSPFAVPVHAPTSGEVVAIAPHVIAHPSGLSEMCVSIRPDGDDKWAPLTPLANYQELPPQQVIEAICNAGVSGMGGAGFPTHIKTASSKDIEFLIINGVECEPYISADDRLMREFAWQIRQGIDVLDHLLSPKAVVIAIEDNKPEAIEAIKIACQDKPEYRVVVIETVYPAGGEKQLIQVVTGREVPRHGLPADVGVLMFNVATSYAIADAIFHGKPLIERIVTVTGEAVQQRGNYWALIGTPVSHMLAHTNYLPKKQRHPEIVMGGPMMGFTLTDTAIPVVKITNCLLVPAAKELPADDNERPCIRCSDCAQACPASLLPQQLFWHAKAKELDKAEEYDLFDCIECGACAYVCPSEIPLVHYYRQAKAEIRTQRDERNKAEKAKERFEARKARLEREKLEREEKHRKAKAAREAAGQKTDGGTKDKVAAALARAKAKKAAAQEVEKTTDDAPAVDDKKAQVAAAIARAKAKKAAVQQADNNKTDTTEDSHPNTDDNTTPSDHGKPEKQLRVAAAVAKAKAKKAAAQQADHNNTDAGEDSHSNTDDNTTPNDHGKSEKQQRVAAAVAKAKAKKAAAQQPDHNKSDTAEDSHSNTDDNTTPNDNAKSEKQQRVAAAVAKAKAKKAAAQQPDHNKTDTGEDSHSNTDDNTTPNDHAKSEKQQRVAAAVAKAKAKKAARDQVLPQDSDTADKKEPDADSHHATADAQTEKQRRIAAAVAKAKAKKAAKANNESIDKDESAS